MTSPSARPRFDWRALTMGFALLLVAVLIYLDTGRQTLNATYGMGPAAMPMIVAGALVALALGHLFVAFRDGVPVPERGDALAIAWVGAGLLWLLGCIALGGGFIAATGGLFAMTARAFGRRAFLVDIAIGLALGVAIHLLFSRLLTLSLPAGPLERLL